MNMGSFCRSRSRSEDTKSPLAAVKRIVMENGEGRDDRRREDDRRQRHRSDGSERDRHDGDRDRERDTHPDSREGKSSNANFSLKTNNARSPSPRRREREDVRDQKDNEHDRKRSKSRSRSPRERVRKSQSRSRSRSRSRERRRSRSRSYSPRRGGGGRQVDCGNDEDGYRLHVADLDINANKRELERAFGKYGPLKEIWIAATVPCFAFVVYRYKEDAEEAARKSDGIEFCGRRVRVTVARPRTKGTGRRGFDPSMRCYQCGDRGHFSRDCPDSKYGYKRPPSPRRSGGGKYYPENRDRFDGRRFDGRRY